MTGGPSKEHANCKSSGKVKRRCHVSNRLPESFSLESILDEQCMRHQEGLWVRMIGQRQPETKPITIKPETASHAAEQFSWVPLPCCPPPWCPFPIKSLALSAHGSPWTTHFWVLDKSPVSGPGRGPSSYNNTVSTWPLTSTFSTLLILVYDTTINIRCNFLKYIFKWR